MNETMAHYILYRLDQVEANTRPRAGWIAAIIVSIVVNLFIVPYLQKHEVPYLSAGLNAALEYEAELAIDLGILVADTITGADRAAPSLPTGMSIIGLAQEEANAFIESVRKSEAPNYITINWAGYQGQWQFGAEALVMVGLVKREHFEAAKRNGILKGNGGWRGQKQWLRNPDHWTIMGGQNTFLSRKDIQDAAFVKLCNMNIRDGFRMRVLSKKTPANKIAGWAKAAHLKGIGAAKRWYKYKIDSKDGNETRVSLYARQAESAVLNAQAKMQTEQSRSIPKGA